MAKILRGNYVVFFQLRNQKSVGEDVITGVEWTGEDLEYSS
jgi:hypothetical protein